MFQFQSEGRKTANNPVREPSGRDNSLLVERKISLFLLFRLSSDWMSPTHIREQNLPFSVY